MESIIIWDTDVQRIRACEVAVLEALKVIGVKATIQVNSEAPLISRFNLWDRLPVLEIRRQHWSLSPKKTFTKEQLVGLFNKIFIIKRNLTKEK